MCIIKMIHNNKAIFSICSRGIKVHFFSFELNFLRSYIKVFESKKKTKRTEENNFCGIYIETQIHGYKLTINFVYIIFACNILCFY